MKTLALRLITFSLIAMFVLNAAVFAQSDLIAKPRSERLLNDLDVLIWSTAGTGRVKVRLRIHNGAAYDPADKQGTFALLGEILFPGSGIREYFREDLGGDLSVNVNYDYVEVIATARADAFLDVLETLTPALQYAEITKEKTEEVKQLQLSDIAERRESPDYTVVAAAAERLFGEFPYGRRYEGTAESLSRIDFGDVIYVRERFLTADNATLAIIGDVRSDYAYLAARRLMGGWNKAGTSIPATFRLPETPDTETRYVYVQGDTANRSVAAVESFARSDKRYHAAEILGRLINSRLNSGSGDVSGLTANAANQGFLLKGMFHVFTEDLSAEAAVPGGNSRMPARDNLTKWLRLPPTPAEFRNAKEAYLQQFRALGPDGLRADVDTYKLSSAAEELAAVEGVTIGDLGAVAAELLRRPIVEVVFVSRPPVVPDPPADPKDPK